MLFHEIDSNVYKLIRASQAVLPHSNIERVLVSVVPNGCYRSMVDKYNTTTALFHHRVLVKLNPTAEDMAEIIANGLTGYYVDIYEVYTNKAVVDFRFYLGKQLPIVPAIQRKYTTRYYHTIIVGSDMRIRRYYNSTTLANTPGNYLKCNLGDIIIKAVITAGGVIQYRMGTANVMDRSTNIVTLDDITPILTKVVEHLTPDEVIDLSAFLYTGIKELT